MDDSSDDEQENPKRLKTLACSARFTDGNILLHQFVLENSVPNGSVDESCLNAVLRSMSDVPGSAVNAVNDDGYNALHLSVLKGNLPMVKGLLSCLRNIDVDATCDVNVSCPEIYHNCGSTALHLAAESGNLGIIEELCNKGAAIDKESFEEETALHIAAQYGQLDAMKLLVSKGAVVNLEYNAEWSPLGAAASLRCNLEAVKYLVECGADVNPRYVPTPLYYAVRSGDAAIVEYLMSNGAEVKSDDELLHCAVESGSVEIVECLLRSGADVNAKGLKEFTPLHWAAMEGRSEMATLLLDRGANANARCDYDRTPLHYAVWKRNLFIRKFTGFREGWVKPDAAMRKKNEMAESLIEQGADLCAIDEEGRTPLHDAVCGKNDEWIRDYDERYREIAKLIRTLVERGADVNARDKDGRTPLEFPKIDLKMYEGS